MTEARQKERKDRWRGKKKKGWNREWLKRVKEEKEGKDD